MRIHTKIVLDMESGELIARTSEPYDGPIWHLKGNAAKSQALTNAGTAASDSSTLMNEGQTLEGAELPFLEGEITNPQGFQQSTLNAMQTAAGQGASGAVSNAEQQAKLAGARSGNVGSESAIIANAARAGANAQSNANLQTQIANAKAKMQQQQQGAAGVMDLTGMDMSDALNSLGLSDESINAWSNANKSAGNLWSNAFGPLIESAMQGASTYFGKAAAGGGGGGAAG